MCGNANRLLPWAKSCRRFKGNFIFYMKVQLRCGVRFSERFLPSVSLSQLDSAGYTEVKGLFTPSSKSDSSGYSPYSLNPKIRWAFWLPGRSPGRDDGRFPSQVLRKVGKAGYISLISADCSLVHNPGQDLNGHQAALAGTILLGAGEPEGAAGFVCLQQPQKGQCPKEKLNLCSIHQGFVPDHFD